MQAQQPLSRSAATGGARPPQIQRADGTPIRVLVVDDEPSLAELLASVLRYEGWDIRTAGDGASAVRMARDFRPDAVVLDIMLPDFDGMEVLRRVRAELPHVLRAVPDRAGRGRGPRRRDHRGRGRLRDQAVQPGRGAGAAARRCCAGRGSPVPAATPSWWSAT